MTIAIQREIDGCCQRAQRASVLVVDHGTVLSARFHDSDDANLCLLVTPAREVDLCLDPPWACSVIFRSDDETRSFLSTVRAAEWRSVGVELVLPLPRSIAGSRCRLAPRTAVPYTVSMEAWIEGTPGDWILARVRDFSVGGACLELPDGVAPFPVRSRRPLTLRAAGYRVSLQCEVRRVDGQAVGVMFCDTLRHGSLAPPGHLSRMHRAVELEWLRASWAGQLAHAADG
jgi:hypothetical protein